MEVGIERACRKLHQQQRTMNSKCDENYCQQRDWPRVGIARFLHEFCMHRQRSLRFEIYGFVKYWEGLLVFLAGPAFLQRTRYPGERQPQMSATHLKRTATATAEVALRPNCSKVNL